MGIEGAYSVEKMEIMKVNGGGTPLPWHPFLPVGDSSKKVSGQPDCMIRDMAGRSVLRVTGVWLLVHRHQHHGNNIWVVRD